jgi:hypothetical protein
VAIPIEALIKQSAWFSIVPGIIWSRVEDWKEKRDSDAKE